MASNTTPNPTFTEGLTSWVQGLISPDALVEWLREVMEKLRGTGGEEPQTTGQATGNAIQSERVDTTASKSKDAEREGGECGGRVVNAYESGMYVVDSYDQTLTYVGPRMNTVGGPETSFFKDIKDYFFGAGNDRDGSSA